MATFPGAGAGRRPRWRGQTTEQGRLGNELAPHTQCALTTRCDLEAATDTGRSSGVRLCGGPGASRAAVHEAVSESVACKAHLPCPTSGGLLERSTCGTHIYSAHLPGCLPLQFERMLPGSQAGIMCEGPVGAPHRTLPMPSLLTSREDSHDGTEEPGKTKILHRLSWRCPCRCRGQRRVPTRWTQLDGGGCGRPAAGGPALAPLSPT